MALATGATINLIMNQQWLQPLLKKVLPAPGQGPSRDAMMNGRYRMAVVGYSQVRGSVPDVAGRGKASLEVRIWQMTALVG